MHILVLGGYGLIGLAVSKRLLDDGHNVVGLARSARKGIPFLPSADWVEADISTLIQPQNWLSYLAEIDVVVNASGVLQSGLSDNVSAVQRDAIIALISACEQIGISKFIQISAPGASEDAKTEFYQTKGAADNALKESSLKWTIFRPGLVISPHAYGGTSLLRALTAFPIIQPIFMAKTPVQTVSVDDVANAVSLAVQNEHGGRDFDLVAPESHTLDQLVLRLRSWLGFSKPKAVLSLPGWVGRLTALLADWAGWLGWRSALRTTAITVLSDGVTGDPNAWANASGQSTKTFEQTLRSIPSTAQERVYARAMLAFPVALITLAGFWIASGMVGFMQDDEAIAVISDVLPKTLAGLFVRAGSIIDILIGVLLLIRPVTRFACAASIVVSVGYILASAVFTPELWADPMGPMVKVFPAIALALFVAAIAEER